MIFDFLFIILGVALVLFGADKLTEGAAALARRMNVPEIIIGLTIVAAGTSAPELFVSLVSALNGTPSLSVSSTLPLWLTISIRSFAMSIFALIARSLSPE